jgi:hypothetical protein
MAITFVLYVVGNFQYDTFMRGMSVGQVLLQFFVFPCQHHSNIAFIPIINHHPISPDKATHYHTLCSMLGASSLTRHLVGKGKETLRNKNAFNSLVCLTERSGLVVNTPAS